MSARGRVVVAAAVLTVALSASACTVGEASSFRGRANDACAKVTRSIERYPAPVTGDRALKYANDRYQNYEKLVSEITEDISVPGGTTGKQLDAGWFDPARASLRQGRHDLDALSAAAREDKAGPAPAGLVLPALVAGTVGVDTDLLRREGLAACAVTFTTPESLPSA